MRVPMLLAAEKAGARSELRVIAGVWSSRFVLAWRFDVHVEPSQDGFVGQFNAGRFIQKMPRAANHQQIALTAQQFICPPVGGNCGFVFASHDQQGG